MYVRRFAQVRVKTKLSDARFGQRAAYLKVAPPLRLTTRPHFDRIAGPKCYASIQFVNQSGNSPNSSPHFLREFGSLTRESISVPLYTTVLYSFIVRSVHCGGRVGISFDSLLRSFTQIHHFLCYKYNNSANDTSSNGILEFDET